MVKPTLLALALIASDSCGSSKPPPAQPAAQREMKPHEEMCPMKIAGTRIVANDTVDGVALELTTTGDVAQLRAHIREMASMHDHMMGHGGMKMVPSTARVEDTDLGARIVLVPTDPAQLAQLRAHVHEHAEMMASGHCPMMMEHGS